jgi:cytidine deaminase
MSLHPTVPEDLLTAAKSVVKFIQLRDSSTAGSVGAAIRSVSGKIFTGICLDFPCGLGFCAEHAAVAEMLKHGETQIVECVAVNADGILPPCGRCRQLLAELDLRNARCRIWLTPTQNATLYDLLPASDLPPPNA